MFFHNLFNPGTFLGAMFVGVIAGVIAGFITGYFTGRTVQNKAKVRTKGTENDKLSTFIPSIVDTSRVTVQYLE